MVARRYRARFYALPELNYRHYAKCDDSEREREEAAR
jgi:hypothetical protein